MIQDEQNVKSKPAKRKGKSDKEVVGKSIETDIDVTFDTAIGKDRTEVKGALADNKMTV